jgi:hypothetical protein
VGAAIIDQNIGTAKAKRTASAVKITVFHYHVFICKTSNTVIAGAKFRVFDNNVFANADVESIVAAQDG